MSNHHGVYFKYLTIVFVNYIAIKLKNIKNYSMCNQHCTKPSKSGLYFTAYLNLDAKFSMVKVKFNSTKIIKLCLTEKYFKLFPCLN